jgi:hypothetical protein
MFPPTNQAAMESWRLNNLRTNIRVTNKRGIQSSTNNHSKIGKDKYEEIIYSYFETLLI